MIRFKRRRNVISTNTPADQASPRAVSLAQHLNAAIRAGDLREVQRLLDIADTTPITSTAKPDRAPHDAQAQQVGQA